MANAKYQITRERRSLRQLWRGWSRMRKALATAGALALVTAVVAVAALLFRAPITGSVDVSDVRLEWGATVVVTNTTGVITCTPTRVSATNMQINVTNAVPGSSCDIQGMVYKIGTPVLKVQDVEFNDTVEVAFLSGICGREPGTNPTGSPNMAFRITVPEGTPPGNYVASASAGVTAVASGDYVDADCPRA